MTAAAERLLAAGRAGTWRPTGTEVAAITVLRDHHARIWSVDGSPHPPGSAALAVDYGVDLLEDPAAIRAETAAVYADVLARELSLELRLVLEHAADYEPQPARTAGWQVVFGPVLTGLWGH